MVAQIENPSRELTIDELIVIIGSLANRENQSAKNVIEHLDICRSNSTHDKELAEILEVFNSVRRAP